MTKYIFLFSLLFAGTTLVLGQTEPNPSDSPNIGYPVTDVMESEALVVFDENFPEQNVGFFHIYADPSDTPPDTYLLQGNPANGTVMALLPKKYQRMAERMNAEVYAAAAVRGIRENMYIVRMDGPTSDRLEMFALRGGKVKHLKTLAYAACSDGTCTQTDSYLTDINGDTDLDLVTIKRTRTSSGDSATKRKVYTLNERNRKWKKARNFDTPWDSINFYDSRTGSK